ncbi:MAG: ABC transporter ATP-binding protein [Acidimicrobiales bacterium]
MTGETIEEPDGTFSTDSAQGGSVPGGSVVRIAGVSHSFAAPDGARRQVLDSIDLEIRRGEFVAIVGPSGCGKTTLLNLVAGLVRAEVGIVQVHGGRPKVGDPEVGYLFARDALLPWRTVLGNAELALEIAGVAKTERRRRAEELLASVGLADSANAYPAQLSQGMRQRVAIARTLATRPDLLMLDEPFSALDAQTKLLLQDTFSHLWAGLGATVVLITHDLSEAISLADRVVLMTARPGRIKRVFEVDLPRPRSVVTLQSEEAYHRMYQQLWSELSEEVVRQ